MHRRGFLMLLLAAALLLTSCSPIGPAAIGLLAFSGKKSRKETPPAPVLPARVADPTPAQSATSVPVTTNLAWSAASNADSYDIYFGTDPIAVNEANTTSAEYHGSQIFTFFDPSPADNLSYDTTYYWRIDSVNAAGKAQGDLWGFATESAPAAVPDMVQNPTPADSATNIATDQILSWDAATGATSYDVYFGTAATSVANATSASAEFMGNQTGVSYDPGGVSYSATYYWRIDSRNSVGPTEGDLWSFTTKPPPPVADFSADVTSGDVPLTVSFTDASTGSVTSWSWDFGDGGTSSEQNPSHQYINTGTYSVSLTVTGPGGSDSITKTGYITVTEPTVLDTIYVATTGNDTTGDGTVDYPYATIQKGLDSAASGTTVIVLDGTYTGLDNKNLDFTGKDIYLKSTSGAAACIIDCENSGRGIFFHSDETNAAVIEGFTIKNGNPSGRGGAICCWPANPTIANCVLTNNTAEVFGGGIFCANNSAPTVTNCKITLNSVTGNGGGIACWNNSIATITNCVVSSNTATTYGGGIYSADSDVTITNATIDGNTADSGGGIFCGASNPMLNNTILWDNSATSGKQIYNNDISFTVTLNYCDYANGVGDVEGLGTVTPSNCITLDSLFVDAVGGDYRLMGTSPCIDAGDNSLVPVGITTDLDGDLRFRDGDSDTTATVDIGAYEHRTWIDVSPAGIEGTDYPSARDWHAMAYDSNRGVVVLFGGNTGVLNDETWEWNGTNWTQKFPANSPSVREYHDMAYDSARGVVVLFGGYDGGYYDDTWEWDGNNWTQRFPTNKPSARDNYAMAYDSSRSVVMLFGGWDGAYNNETWEWDGIDWTQRFPATSPSARYVHAMVYDSARDVVVLFGGYDSVGRDGGTWEWDGVNWTQKFPANSPSARWAHAMAYDSARNRVMLFGGLDSTEDDETWEWDGSNWTQKIPANSPSARYRHAMAYDRARGVVVLFGGYDGSYYADTWEY